MTCCAWEAFGSASPTMSARPSQRLGEPTRIVLLDLRLPGGDGGEVFRRVREVNPSARVILMTGYRDEMSPVVGLLMAEGVDAVHYKPFDVPQLLEDLGQLAGGTRGANRVLRRN